MDFDYISSYDKTMQATPETNQRLKCGEITLNNRRKISFSCHFCPREVNSIGHFLRHILKEHLIFSKEEIEALLIGAKSKQARNSVLDKSAEIVQQDYEQSEDLFNADSVKDEPETQVRIEQLQVESDDYINNSESFVNSVEYTSAKLEQNEDISYATSLKEQEEEDHEEFELLEDFFETVPAIAKKETEMREVNFEIEVLHQEYEESRKEIKPKVRQVKNYKNGMQKANETTARQSMQTTNKTRGTTIKPATITTAEDSSRIMCKICKKIFKTHELLDVHLERHAEVKAKPFICEYCDAQFSHKSNLNVHVKRHLGIKPYGCPLCDKSFTSSTELKLHMIIHTGSKLFKCHVCNQEFARQFQLKSHSRRHYNERPYVCEICGSDFFDSRQLREHETIHSVERPFSCEACGATFKRSKALREHKKLHLAEKMYECKICAKTFAQYAGLYAHIKTHKLQADDL